MQHLRTTDFREVSAAAYGEASGNFYMLDLVSMYTAWTTLKNWRAGLRIKVALKLGSAFANHCMACCGSKYSKLH